jgi:biotin transport system substrate-specific component
MSAPVVHRTLVDAVWRPRDRTVAILRELLLLGAFSLLTVASARVSFALPSTIGEMYSGLMRQFGIILPQTPVPVTGQTFAVLLTGLILGSRRGGLTMLLYLGYGLAGLGVFALGLNAWSPSPVAGVPVILGPTAGYLCSYPLAAFTVGLLAERGWDRRIGSTALAMGAGSVVIYALALPWLARYVGAHAVLALGLYPFIAGDALKLLVAAGLLPAIWRVLHTLGWRNDRTR